MLISLPAQFISNEDGQCLLKRARLVLDNSDEIVIIDVADCHVMAGHAPNILASLFVLYPLTMLRRRLQIINPSIHAGQIKLRIVSAQRKNPEMSLTTFAHNTRLWQEYAQNLHLQHVHQGMIQLMDEDIALLREDVQAARELPTLAPVEQHALTALDYQIRSYEYNQAKAKDDATRRKRVAAHYAREYMAETGLDAGDPQCLIKARVMLLGLAIGATGGNELQPPSCLAYNALFALADSMWAQRALVQPEWDVTD